MTHMLHGALVALAFVAALFFFRFWQRTKDRFFALFAAAFAALSVVALGWPIVDFGEFVYRAATPTSLKPAAASTSANRAGPACAPSASPTSCACRRRSWPTRPFRPSPSPPSATTAPTTAKAGGTASRSSAGWVSTMSSWASAMAVTRMLTRGS